MAVVTLLQASNVPAVVVAKVGTGSKGKKCWEGVFGEVQSRSSVWGCWTKGNVGICDGNI